MPPNEIEEIRTEKEIDLSLSFGILALRILEDTYKAVPQKNSVVYTKDDLIQMFYGSENCEVLQGDWRKNISNCDLYKKTFFMEITPKVNKSKGFEDSIEITIHSNVFTNVTNEYILEKFCKDFKKQVKEIEEKIKKDKFTLADLEIIESIPILKNLGIEPDYFEPNKEYLRLISFCVANSMNLFSWGVPGSGKTSTIEYYLNKNSIPYIRLNGDGDYTKEDFLGDTVLKSYRNQDGTFIQVTEYIDGFLTVAMRSGKILLLDEVDLIPPQALANLQAVLEGKPLCNTRKNENIYPAKGFAVFATANTVGFGDETGLYQGTNTLNNAFMDRFKYVWRSYYPSPEVETRIIAKKTGIIITVAERIVKLATTLRKAIEEGKLLATFSIRRTEALAQAFANFGETKFAFEIGLINRFPDSLRNEITTIAANECGYEFLRDAYSNNNKTFKRNKEDEEN